MQEFSNPTDSPVVETEARRLLQEYRQRGYRRADRLFAILMPVQWLLVIAAALWISPRTWIGASSQIHTHVWAAIVLGGLITSLPVFFALVYPGRWFTRHTIAVGQVLTSCLLIHLTGGRIETHFHVFGSLAFLAFYRDWPVLISASAVVAVDHLVRGALWPQSVYGVIAGAQWRWLEHAAWVVFEDVILISSCMHGVREMAQMARRQAQLDSGMGSAVSDLRAAVAAIEQNAQALAHSSTALTAVSHQMSASAEETACQAGVVLHVSSGVSENVQRVVVASDEIGVRMEQIAGDAAEAAQVVAAAVQAVETTDVTVSALGRSGAEIGQVIKVIEGIANQINLLALNATIEAARAGEAGKGFTVVAHEVKELAKETAQATDQIRECIGSIQTNTSAAVEAIQEIITIITRVHEIQSGIAGAVDEQKRSTEEIRYAVAEAARGVTEISDKNRSMAEAAASTSQGATETQNSAADLARVATELQRLVARHHRDAQTGDFAQGPGPGSERPTTAGYAWVQGAPEPVLSGRS